MGTAVRTNNRAYLTVAIGCTGQHRSVYVVERLTAHFSARRNEVLSRHRELKRQQPDAAQARLALLDFGQALAREWLNTGPG